MLHGEYKNWTVHIKPLFYFSSSESIFFRAASHGRRGSSLNDVTSISSFFKSWYSNDASLKTSALLSGQSKCFKTARSSTWREYIHVVMKEFNLIFTESSYYLSTSKRFLKMSTILPKRKAPHLARKQMKQHLQFQHKQHSGLLLQGIPQIHPVFPHLL